MLLEFSFGMHFERIENLSIFLIDTSGAKFLYLSAIWNTNALFLLWAKGNQLSH